VSGVFPIDSHHHTPEPGPWQGRETPATLRDAPPGFKPSAATTLEARVLGRDAQGHLMLRTRNGVLTLATRANPPTGSDIVIQFRTVGAGVQAYILGPRAGSAGAARGPTARLPAAYGGVGHGIPPQRGTGVAEGPNALTRAWPALEESLAALGSARADRPDAIAALLGRLPQPGSQFASALLFLLAALRRGDLRAWLGSEPLSALQRIGRGDLADRLDRDFARLSGFTEEDEDHWRLYTLPVWIEGMVRPLRLFVHAPEASETRGAAHRIVVEAELPHLGQLQLDALLQTSRLDMILRSREGALDEPLRARLDALMQEALRRGRLDGSLTFQPGSKWGFLDPPVPTEPRHGIVV
jgi:hypothetical protein